MRLTPTPQFEQTEDTEVLAKLQVAEQHVLKRDQQPVTDESLATGSTSTEMM